MAYTKTEKETLIKYIRNHTDKRLQALNDESARIAETCENKVLRRLNSVSVTLWNIRLKDALEVERDHKPTIKNLLNDIKQLQENSSSSSNSSKNIPYSIRNTRQSTSTGKVTKP